MNNNLIVKELLSKKFIPKESHYSISYYKKSTIDGSKVKLKKDFVLEYFENDTGFFSCLEDNSKLKINMNNDIPIIEEIESMDIKRYVQSCADFHNTLFLHKLVRTISKKS